MRGTHLQEAHVASDRSLCEWQAVGLAEQAPETGSYFVASVAQEPIVILRDDRGALIALSRVCRHRGYDMLEGEGHSSSDLKKPCGRIKRLSCPYHAWTYNLQGQLIGAPVAEQIPGFNKSDVRLPRFPVAVRSGVVFVSLREDSLDLDAQLAEQQIDLEQLKTKYNLAKSS